MSMMRTHRLSTYMQAQEAYTVIEFLDQVRGMLLEAYGDDITVLLQQQSSAPPQREPGDLFDDEETF